MLHAQTHFRAKGDRVKINTFIKPNTNIYIILFYTTDISPTKNELFYPFFVKESLMSSFLYSSSLHERSIERKPDKSGLIFGLIAVSLSCSAALYVLLYVPTSPSWLQLAIMVMILAVGANALPLITPNIHAKRIRFTPTSFLIERMNFSGTKVRSVKAFPIKELSHFSIQDQNINYKSVMLCMHLTNSRTVELYELYEHGQATQFADNLTEHLANHELS